jgi:hypothetical protein
MLTEPQGVSDMETIWQVPVPPETTPPVPLAGLKKNPLHPELVLQEPMHWFSELVSRLPIGETLAVE